MGQRPPPLLPPDERWQEEFRAAAGDRRQETGDKIQVRQAALVLESVLQLLQV